VLDNKQIGEILKDGQQNAHYFTVQALTNCQLFKLNINHLGRMIAEFPEAFSLIFANADVRLIKLLKQQIKIIKYT
jgi:hypothetical protein